jgi:hypothetical protein
VARRYERRELAVNVCSHSRRSLQGEVRRRATVLWFFGVSLTTRHQLLVSCSGDHGEFVCPHFVSLQEVDRTIYAWLGD